MIKFSNFLNEGAMDSLISLQYKPQMDLYNMLVSNSNKKKALKKNIKDSSSPDSYKKQLAAINQEEKSKKESYKKSMESNKDKLGELRKKMTKKEKESFAAYKKRHVENLNRLKEKLKSS